MNSTVPLSRHKASSTRWLADLVLELLEVWLGYTSTTGIHLPPSLDNTSTSATTSTTTGRANTHWQSTCKVQPLFLLVTLHALIITPLLVISTTTHWHFFNFFNFSDLPSSSYLCWSYPTTTASATARGEYTHSSLKCWFYLFLQYMEYQMLRYCNTCESYFQFSLFLVISLIWHLQSIVVTPICTTFISVNPETTGKLARTTSSA